MKAAGFRYERPESLDEALALMSDDSVEVAALAGGQSLMPMMNFRIAQPEVLVDLNSVPGLSGLTVSDGMLRIGAMTRYADLQRSEEVAKYAPLVARALPFVAHSAIRNRGTLGGSLALADPAAEMPAVMLALGAEISVQGQSTIRTIPVDDFFLGVYETALNPGELVTCISVPVTGNAERFGFYEIARRHGDYAMAGIAIAIRKDTRCAFFSVADRAVRSRGAEAALDGDPSDVDAAVSALDDIEFDGDLNASAEAKRHYAGVVLRRGMEDLR